MSASTVVTMGYSISGGLQARVGLLPTLGYGQTLISPPTTEGMEFKAAGIPLHAAVSGKLHGKAASGRMHVRLSGRLHGKARGEPLHFRQEED